MSIRDVVPAEKELCNRFRPRSLWGTKVRSDCGLAQNTECVQCGRAEVVALDLEYSHEVEAFLLAVRLCCACCPYGWLTRSGAVVR